MVDGNGPDTRLDPRHGIQPRQPAGDGTDRQPADQCRIELGFGQGFDGDAVLVAGAVDFADAASAQGVVERLLYRARIDTEPRRFNRVERHPQLGIAQIEVAVHVGDQWRGAERLLDFRQHMLERLEIARGQGDLIVARRCQRADVDRRRVLQHHVDAADLAAERPQFLDHLIRARTGIARRQPDHQTADIAAGDAAAALAGRGHQAFDGGMTLHQHGELLLPLRQFLEGNAFGILHTGEQHAGIDTRDESLFHLAGQPYHRAQHRDRQQQHRTAVPHRGAQRLAVPVAECAERPVEQAREGIVDRFVHEPARTQHRCQRERHHAGQDHRHADGDGELLEQPADHAAHEQDGQKHGGQRNRHRQHGEADLLRTVERRLHARLAHVEMARDVLDHHHRVVDHETDGERDRHQRKIVEAVARQMHEGEGAEQRARQHQRGDERGAHVVQEGKDHQDDQAERQHQREIHFVQRILDEQRTVEMHLQADAVGQFGFDLRQHRADALGDFDRVGTGLPLNREHNGARAVVPGARLVVFHAVDRAPQVADTQRGAVLVGHDDIAEPVRVGERDRRLHRIGACRTVQRAGRQVRVRRLYRGDHIGEGQPARKQFFGVEIEPQRIFLRAEHQHLGHAGQGRQALRDMRIGHRVKLGERQPLGRQGEIEDGRIGRVDLAQLRRIHAVRQVARRLRDGGLHILRGGIDIAPQLELQRDVGRALARLRGHRFDTLYRRELPFERRGHRVGHRLRVRAGQTGGNPQRREIDLRQIVHRQFPVGERAEQRHRQHQHQRGDRPLDEQTRKVHLAASRAGGRSLSRRTAPPARRRCGISISTGSPAASSPLTACAPSSARNSVTGCATARPSRTT